MSDTAVYVRCVPSPQYGHAGRSRTRGVPPSHPPTPGGYAVLPASPHAYARVGARPSRTPQIPLDDTEQGHRQLVGGVWVEVDGRAEIGRERAAQEFSQVRAHEQSRNIRHMH